jgi:hypothetical protein
MGLPRGPAAGGRKLGGWRTHDLVFASEGCGSVEEILVATQDSLAAKIRP